MDDLELKNHMTPDEIEEFDNLANSQIEFKKCVNHWTEYQVRQAIKEGRITRIGASEMFHALMDAVTQTCHDYITPPDME